jgi:hypothetical protein
VAPHVLRLVVGVCGMLCALLVPLAPVLANQTIVSWPAAGQAPETTTALFVPARPAEVHAVVPCSVVRSGQLAPRGATLLATDVPDRSTRALVVSVHGQELHVLSGGQQVLASTVEPAGCDIRVDSTDESTRVVAGHAAAVRHGWQYVPELHAFATELGPRQATGMHLTARPHVWFENAPTTGKLVLIAVQLALAAVSLGLLAGRRGPRGPRRGLRPSRLLVDAAVMVTLAYWVIAGPLTDDDGFATVTVRNSMLSGDIGNYYRWINTSEAPFTLLQRMLEPLVSWSVAPVVLRLPSALAGIALWWVLSRGVLGVILPAIARTWWVRLIAAFALLAWWLPYDLGVRSEPFVALGSAAVLALILRGTAPRARGWLPLGAAALVAALTVSLNPEGVLALIPGVVLAPRLVRALGRGDHEPRWWAVLGRLALLGCVSATALVAMFGGQTWAGVVRATWLHRYFGPAFPWYREIVRYEYLLGNDENGNATKRLPVLLTLALLVPVAMLISRGLRRLQPEAHVPALCTVAAFAALWLTPSKWSHHFGALAGFGPTVLVTGAVLIASAARSRPRDRAVLVNGGCGGVLAVVATALSFSGKNNWYSYSEYGQPWTEGPIAAFHNPVLWFGAVVVAGLVLARVAADWPVRRVAGVTTAAAPAMLAVVAPTVSVAVLLTSFAIAPLRQLGGHSLAAQNLRDLGGGGCGIVDDLLAMPDLPGGALRQVRGATVLSGFAPDAGYSPAPPHVMPGVSGMRILWGSNLPALGGESNTGALTTGWYALPRLGPGRDLAVTVAGRTGDGNRVALEFGRADGPAVRTLGERVLDDSYKDPDKRPVYPTSRVPVVKPQDVPRWRALSVGAGRIPPGSDLVRVRAVDATTDKGGWVAVTQPRLRAVVPLREVLNAHPPVLPSSDMSWSMPCVRNIPVVEHGLAGTPRALVLPGNGFSGIGGVPFNEDMGGTFTGLQRWGTWEEIPTRLIGPKQKPKDAEWGHVLLMTETFRLDAYSVHTIRVQRWGW